MSETVDISLSSLLLDPNNPRLAEEFETQQEAALALARQLQTDLVEMAADIVENGLDPLSTMAVVATKDRRKRYRVLEGNRRLLALRALETPSLVNPALSQRDSRRLTSLSAQFEEDPIETVRCELFLDEDEALHWVELRHTGKNKGAGLIEWGSEEKDRFKARHSGLRGVAGQVLDFVDRVDAISDEAKSSKRSVATSVRRLLTTPKVREAVGVEVRQGQVFAVFKPEAVARSLGFIVEDFKSGNVNVGDIYKASDRERYAEEIPKAYRPKASERLPDPVPLDDLSSPATSPKSKPKPRPPRRKKRDTSARTTIVPRGCPLEVTTPRVNALFNELLELNADTFPNAAAVLMRVFIELSTDHYVAENALMTESEMRHAPLAKRMKKAAEHLHGNDKIPAKLKVTVEHVANGSSVLLPSVATFNQYVHNQFSFPKPTDLRYAWDELEPFLARIWPS